MPDSRKRSLALAAVACLALAGCGDSPDGGTQTSAPPQPQAQAPEGPSAAVRADRTDARQNVARLADVQKMIDRYVADFDEIAPVHAAAGDVAATQKDASTAYAAVGGFTGGFFVFDSPPAAEQQLDGYKQAVREAKLRLGEVGKGQDLTAEVERAKRALDELTPAANELSAKLESIATGQTG